MTARIFAYRPGHGAGRALLGPTLAILLATPAAAADFPLPAGCEAFLTVQSKGCSVSLLWRCDVAPDGDFSEASFGPEGLEALVNYSRSYQWIESAYSWDSSREEYLPPANDPIDVATLLDTGIDTYDFAMRRSEPDATYDIRVTGADMLTGETTEIDGYTLDLVRTRLEIMGEQGQSEYRAQGMQYFSRELGHFFLGTETVFGEDGSEAEYDSSPLDIIRPGEAGFGLTTPLYECTRQDAALTAPILPTPDDFPAMETDHDQV
ncbi:hypothetical protein [Sinisalibacter aestuarii]|uniref:Uncharacterized protein n=1 Tax=Sinisalibacter aestuarii TaxID=2949426 RepID=A0ABQ5LNP2_9RHOB|nr:hypothetical protein [Sinisalibacter aestuarii]GKY86624.1 hypothetical protein STA1M1_04930 [Sinisalibacter aestuarii]